MHMARASLACDHVYRDGIEHRMRHLAGDGALPDQRIQLELIGVDLAFELLRRDGGRGRAHGFVGFLCILRLGLVDTRRLGKAFLAVKIFDGGADLGHGLHGQRHRVGAHVGDEAYGAFAEIHAFIQLLRQPHGALRRETQLAGGFLLQRGGGEWRRRIALALLAVDGIDGELASGGLVERGLGFARIAFVGEAELLHLLA
jgi:hypothetical protein